MARKIQPRSKTPLPKPGQSSEDYWRERETRQRAANIHDEVRYAERIDEIFQSTQDSLEQEIDAFYQRYATKEGIDVFEARQRVSQIDMKKYERLAEQYVKAAHEGGREAAFSDEANEQMRLYNATMRINRLEMLKARCGIRAMEGYRQVDQLINESLEERAYSEYYRLAGILGNSVQFNENQVRAIVNASYQNATWSQRLWSNQAMLSEQIGAQLVQGILTGKSSTVLARNIQKLTGGSTYACQRLMRTELRRVQTAAAEQSMRDNGVTEYKFIVANGVNPCDECLALDGEVFKLSEMTVGKNASPMHPNCHCATAPYVDEDKWQRWLDGPAQAGVPWAEFEKEEKIKGISASSINKRTPGYGRGTNIAILGAPLSKKQQSILERLPNYDSREEFDKRDVSIRDIIALTAHTGVEFAVFTRNGKRLVIRGNERKVNVYPKDGEALASQGYTWSCHTHPGMNPKITEPSQGDRDVLMAMNQNRSAIYNSTGRCFVFGIDEDHDEGYKNL